MKKGSTATKFSEYIIVKAVGITLDKIGDLIINLD